MDTCDECQQEVTSKLVEMAASGKTEKRKTTVTLKYRSGYGDVESQSPRRRLDKQTAMEPGMRESPDGIHLLK